MGEVAIIRDSVRAVLWMFFQKELDHTRTMTVLQSLIIICICIICICSSLSTLSTSPHLIYLHHQCLLYTSSTVLCLILVSLSKICHHISLASSEPAIHTGLSHLSLSHSTRIVVPVFNERWQQTVFPSTCSRQWLAKIGSTQKCDNVLELLKQNNSIVIPRLICNHWKAHLLYIQYFMIECSELTS